MKKKKVRVVKQTFQLPHVELSVGISRRGLSCLFSRSPHIKFQFLVFLSFFFCSVVCLGDWLCQFLVLLLY